MLLIRVEDPGHPDHPVGGAGRRDPADLFRERMAQRIADALGENILLQGIRGGDLVLRLPKMTDRQALDQALRVQDACALGQDLPAEQVPVVTVIVGRATSAARSEAGLARLRRVLDDCRPGQRGQVVLLDADRPVRVAGLRAEPSLSPDDQSRDPLAAPRIRLAPIPHQARADRYGFDPSWVEPLFQPQISCDTGAVSGFRVTPRVRHPVRGLLTAGEFARCSSAEDRRALTLVLLRAACGALGNWDQAAALPVTVSLPVRTNDLSAGDFASAILRELDQQDQDPTGVLLELGSIATAAPGARAVQRHLARTGCGIDLSDLGGAGRMLSRKLPPTRVLLGRRLTDGCDRDVAVQQKVLRALYLAEQLDLPTAAISVQTPAERNFLTAIGCGHVSGPAVADPMPLSESLAFLTRHRVVQVAMPRLELRRDPSRDASA
ncbi:EAL domain-containing protein [uncultured Paracoccus sp.]|uniref:EAL domain-containing protein n=1 Tax=uncultured Paracoccus sp. TaxID=189685 RepID=UPI00262828A3|nr:EAL domain-containing protein [uncultured Paracoccus sp.]